MDRACVISILVISLSIACSNEESGPGNQAITCLVSYYGYSTDNTSFTYDKQGRLSSVVRYYNPDNGFENRTYNITYGSSIVLVDGPNDDDVTLEFDTSGRLIKETNPWESTVYEYDSKGLLKAFTNYEAYSNESSTATITWEGGNISRIDWGSGYYITFDYDSKTNPFQQSIIWYLDPVYRFIGYFSKNNLTKSVEYDISIPVEFTGSYVYTYNEHGYPLTLDYEWPVGDPQVTKNYTFEYDCQ